MPLSEQKKQKIILAFDAECLTPKTQSGVAYYTRGLIEALAQNKDVELIGHYFNFLGKRTIINLPHASNIHYKVTKMCSAKVPNMLRRLGLWIPFEVFIRQRADFHLFPAFIGWPSIFKTPSAPIIHDTVFLDHPGYVNGIVRHDLTKLVPTEIARASFIITNSGYSAGRMRHHMAVGDKAIIVGHIPPVHALPISPKRAKEVLTKAGITGKFILFLGNLEPRKNIPALISAYENLDSRIQQDYSLVIAGGKGWLDDDIRRSIERARSKDLSIITPGYVTEEQRAALYSCAALFTLVSVYEGFGMQLLEAMTYGTPILASDIPVLREVAGEAAAYCKTDAKDIAANITKLIADDKQRKRLTFAGEIRLKDFSWRTVSEHIFNKIKEVVQ